MGTVAQIWRHPIKSHGREPLSKVTLTAGQALPWDRHWAVQHDASKHDGTGWAPCQNFMIGTRTPGLAGIWAQLDEVSGTVILRHDDLGEITFNPDTEGARLLDWVRPLCPEGRAMPKTVVKAGSRGMTDSAFPSVSIMNLASHEAVANKAGRPLEIERWRGNIWLEGLEPWAEFDWIGQTIRIGDAEILIRERIERCLHTAANPRTGARDADTLGALETGWGHQDFGVYGEVTKGGDIALGSILEMV